MMSYYNSKYGLLMQSPEHKALMIKREKIHKKRLKAFRNRLGVYQEWWDCLSKYQKSVAYSFWLKHKKHSKASGKKPKIKHIIHLMMNQVQPSRVKKRTVLIDKLMDND